MFIEELRHVRKKWKVPALILVGLLVVSLLSSFAYMGASYGGGGNGAEGIDYYKSTAKNAEKAVKQDATAEALSAAVSANGDYAAYQVLYLDDEGAKETYKKQLTFANQLIDLYGTQKTENTEWQQAYLACISANMALDKTEDARKAFQSSLKNMTLSSDYLSSYTQSLMGKELYTQLEEDLNAAIAVLEPLAETYTASNPEKEEEDTETTAETKDTPVTVLEAAQSNLQYAQMMASMSNPEAQTEEDGTTDQGDTEKTEK